MKILLVYNLGGSGSNFYRLEMPHHHLGENYPVELFSCANLEEIDFSKYDFVLFSRGIDYTGKTKEIAKEIKKHTKLVLDLDDYWILGENHLLYNEWKNNKTSENIKEAIDVADEIIVTTSYLAQSFNRKVHVIPNAVFPEVYNQFQFIELPQNEIMTIGWLGGSCHTEDIELLYYFAQNIDKQRLPVSFSFPHDGNKDGVYEYYKRIITNDYNNVNYTPIPTSGVYDYGLNYSKFDVVIAPLKNTLFNTKKSELKVVEAGFHKKPLIVSKVRPYTDICTNKNSLLCTHTSDFEKAVKTLLQNPNMREDLGNQLYEDVQRFHIKEVNKKRWEVYQSIIQN